MFNFKKLLDKKGGLIEQALAWKKPKSINFVPYEQQTILLSIIHAPLYNNGDPFRCFNPRWLATAC
jgi:hypothetical protein